MSKVIAIHIDENGVYKYYLNAGYMLSYVNQYGHDGSFFIGDLNESISESAKKIVEKKPDSVIFTLAKYNYNISIALAKSIRELNNNIMIFFGGFFAAGNAELILSKYRFIDACFLSEGEETLLSVLNNLDSKKSFYDNVNHIAYREEKTDKVIRIFIPSEQIDINKIPSPYINIIDPVTMNHQYGCVNISSSRGCKFACTYCYHPLIRKRIRHYEIKHIIDEIQLISEKFKSQDEILIDFWDDFFISDREYTINLCKEIENNRKNFGCIIKLKVDTRIDYIDEELLEYLKKANIYYIGFGLENTDHKILAEMNKLGTDATEEDYTKFLAKFEPILKKCKELEIRTGLYIIHGWHNETLKMAKKTLAFCERLHPSEIHQNQLAYYKGSVIYPKNYEDQFYIQYYSNPELYKYNLDDVPDSSLDPFIEHYTSNHKYLILTGLPDTNQKVCNTNYFQNVVCEGQLDGEYLINNCKINSCISLLDNKNLYVQSTPLQGIAYDGNYNFSSISRLADKWHRVEKYKLFQNQNKLHFYPVNIKNMNKLKSYIYSGKMNLIPMDVCSISNRCACEENFRIFIGKDSNIYSCKDGILLGKANTPAKEILQNYQSIKEENIKKYNCNSCELKDCCSKCPKALEKYGTKYCEYMKKRDYGVYQKYLLYLEKRFYFERIDDTKNFYFVDEK